MVMPRALAATLTVLLHLLIVAALLRVTTRVLAPPPAPAAHEMSAERLRDAGERTVGVGVTADPRTDRIILVGENTPAARAGLQHDDIVLNPSVWREAREEGALLLVLILRDGVKLLTPVRVGKICIE